MRLMDTANKRPLMETIYESVRTNVDRLVIAANYILALLIIGYGIMEPYSYFDMDMVPKWNDMLGFVTLVVFGIAILLFNRRDLMRSAGMYALALGAYRFLHAAPNIHRGEPTSYVFLFLTIIALNLMISGMSYLRGVTRGRKTMMLSTSLLIAANVSIILYGVHSGMSLVEYFRYMPGTVIMIVMYTVFLGILNCEQLRTKDLQEIHNRTLDEIRCTWCTMPDASIRRDAASVIYRMFRDRSDWTPVQDGGPVECEYRFEISNKKGTSHALVQKWKGMDPIFLTISDHLDGTLLHAYRFEATSVIVENDDAVNGTWMRLDSDSGTCMNLRIADIEEGSS